MLVILRKDQIEKIQKNALLTAIQEAQDHELHRQNRLYKVLDTKRLAELNNRYKTERERDQTKINQLVNDYESLMGLAQQGQIDMTMRGGKNLAPLIDGGQDRFVFSKWHFTEKEYFK